MLATILNYLTVKYQMSYSEFCVSSHIFVTMATRVGLIVLWRLWHR